MSTTILLRKGADQQHEEEGEIASRFFPVVERRPHCPPNSLIIGRFSTLPFYRELDDDLRIIGSRLINTVQEHNWISGMDWAWDLARFTPKTWTDNDFHQAPEGRYVVKGRTNSRKSHWDTLMYADSKRKALEIASQLIADPMIAQQGIVYREFQELVTYDYPVAGAPITNEWRFFYHGARRLTHGYYWTTAPHPERAELNDAGLALAQRVAERAAKHTTFFVLDIAQKLDGSWTLIEVNEGQQAGVAGGNLVDLYAGLIAIVGS